MSNANNESDDNCPICKEICTDVNMVECTKCLKWIHYECAGVGDEVENDSSWICKICKGRMTFTNAVKSVSSHKSKASRISARKQQLAIIDERLQLIQQKEKLLLERSKIIESIHDDSSDDSILQEKDIGNITSLQKPMTSNEVVKKFLNTIPKASTSKEIKDNFASDPFQLPTAPQEGLPQVTEKYQSGRVRPSLGQPREHNPDEIGLSNNRMDYHHYSIRQSLARELPSFTGKPEEWPIFISSYKFTSKLCRYTNTENLIRLNASLKGKAKEVVEPMLTMPHCVDRIIETLKLYFGRPDILIEHYISKIRQQPAPKGDRLDTLFGFAIAVQNLCVTIEQTELLNHLSNPMLLKELVDKLPSSVKMSWATYKRLSKDGDNLKTMSNFLQSITEDLCAVGIQINSTPVDKPHSKKSNFRESVNVHTETKPYSCIVCEQNCQTLTSCDKFKQLTVNNRWNIVKKHYLCNRCLKKHKNKCERSIPCEMKNCDKKYHPLLHKHEIMMTSVCHHVNSNKVLFRILPVQLYNGNKIIQAYAFLDEGSSTSLITESLCDRLGLVGTNQPFCMKWTNNIRNYEENSMIVNVEIAGAYEGARKMMLDRVRSVKSLNLPKQSLNYDQLCESYPYLSQLPIQSYKNADPQILIGLLNWKVAVPTKSRCDDSGGPIAVKCGLGWTVCANPSSVSTSESVHSYHICECQSEIDHKFDDMISEFCTVDSLGILDPQKYTKTIEEERAAQIMAKATLLRDGRFQTGLLWRSDQIKLPDNRKMALQRLQCFEKRLLANPKMLNNVNNQIKEYLDKGYIRKLSDEDLSKSHDKVWYLPIFTVQNPNKPEKVRIVWDAKASVNGVSLNNVLLKGADLNMSLLGVLFRSRERKVCICGDISEMFHRIKVNDEDQHVLRFFWRNCDQSKIPETYVMMVMTFGATCSPFCAQYIKNQNAMSFADTHPRAVTSIIRNHYVDDMLDCADSAKEALTLASDVKMIHSAAGFNICKWKSNSKEVMQALNQDYSSNQYNMNLNGCTEKVLGMWWMLDTDEYRFSFQYNKGSCDVLYGHKIPTKRELLQILMSIYDPMGLISCYTVYLKMLIQDMWKSKIGWDDIMNEEQSMQWSLWLKYLPEIERLRIPRCFLTNIRNWSNTSVQLHVFTDAGEECCVCVAYLRIEKENYIECALIGSKTKVAPLKLRSIPRLELDAAIMGCRFSNTIQEQLSIKINNRFYWCDSTTVLSWLRNDTKRFSKFVSFRTTEILENSNVNDWRYVPSNMNIADICTKRDKKSRRINISKVWFEAPNFLHQKAEFWPQQKTLVDITEEECCIVVEQEKFKINVTEFTSWKEALNVIADCFKFIDILKKCLKNSDYEVRLSETLGKAQTYLFKLSQVEWYYDEIKCLHNRKQLKKSSVLYKMSPFLDEVGILRIKGRLDASQELSSHTKRPIILPRQHYITALIVDDMHRKFGHHNHETVVNTLRQTYYIPKLRCLLKSIRRKCLVCKLRNVKILIPEMAPLPEERLKAYTEPFTFTGIDCFGPFIVAVGRRREKRWGVIFTCLTTRGIHIEIIYSMDADSFILSFRNFTARRGQPRKVFSDNGTNFVKSERLLREDLANVDFTKVAMEFISPELDWKFNPPSCAHMGGAWERLIRSVKQAVYDSLPINKIPSDALLNSCLVAAEGMVNSRPLTYLPLDSQESEAITPNHFLRLSTGGCKSIGVMDDSAKTLKYNYKYLEQFANKCWRRFIVEYLPELTCRTKWYEKVPELKVGDVVVIIDQKLPRNNYPKARVIETFPGPDGQVRRAKVQTKNSILERPVSKLAILNIRDDH